jgi:hypothetical protein
MYPDSGTSIIVEILEMVEPPQLEDAIKSAFFVCPSASPLSHRVRRFHFDSLANDNSAKASNIEKISLPLSSEDKATPAPILLKGVQSIPKFNRSTLDTVRIYMGLFRIRSKNADLVVSFNVPIAAQDGNAVGAAGQEKAEADFKTFVESLSIVDFELFK